MVFQGKEDQVTVVAAGVIVHEAIAAAEHLKKGTRQQEIQYWAQFYWKDRKYCFFSSGQP